MIKTGLKSEANWGEFHNYNDRNEKGYAFQKAYWALRKMGKNVSDEKTILDIEEVMASIPETVLSGELYEVNKKEATSESFRLSEYPHGIKNVISGKELTEGMSYNPRMLDINELFEKGVAFRGDKIDLSNYPEVKCIQAAEQEQLDMLTPESKKQITSIHLSNNTWVEWYEGSINKGPMSETMDMRSFPNLQKFETHRYCNNDLKEVLLPESVESIKLANSSLTSLKTKTLPIDAISYNSIINEFVHKSNDLTVVRGQYCTAAGRRLKLKESHISEKQSQVKDWKKRRNQDLLGNVKDKLAPAVEETKAPKTAVKENTKPVIRKGKTGRNE